MIGKRRRRARGAILWGLLAFATIQVALEAAVERQPKWRDPAYAEKLLKLQRRLPAAPDNTPVVVVLGSSRTQNDIDASHLEEELAARCGRRVSAFNFGLKAAGPLNELIVLRRLLADKVRPDLLVVEVMPAFLAETGGPFLFTFFPPHTFSIEELSLIDGFSSGAGLGHDWWKGRLIPSQTHRLGLMHDVALSWLPPDAWSTSVGSCDDAGWQSLWRDAQTDERREKGMEWARREYIDHFKNFRLGGSSCRALTEILNLCRAEGIPAALLLLPEITEFRSWYSPDVEDQLEAFLGDLGRKYAATVINGRAWVTDEEFFDGHHLLPQAATDFAERLGPRLSPLLGERAQSTARRTTVTNAWK